MFNLVHTMLATAHYEGRRARFFRELMEGDPVAWAFLIGAVVIFGGMAWWKKRRAAAPADESSLQ